MKVKLKTKYETTTDFVDDVCNSLYDNGTKHESD